MQKGDKVLIRARNSATHEPVLVERIVREVIDAETVEIGEHNVKEITKRGTGLGCWCLPSDNPKAHK